MALCCFVIREGYKPSRAGEYESIDNTTLKRLKEIEKLDDNTKTKIFDIIDTYLRDFKRR